MATILLNKGLVAEVDDADVQLLSGYRWLAVQAGRKTEKHYAVAWLPGQQKKSVYMHRLLISAGSGEYVDHINGDGLDNRRANLRIATAKQNAGNIRVTKGNRSGFRGVFASPTGGKWVARIGTGGRTVGRCATPEEAARAYDAAAIEAYGPFAVLNFPRA